LATAFSSGTGSASASSAHPSNDYSGGIMMAADPNGGYWTVSATGAVTTHGTAPALGSPAQSNLRLAQPIVGMTATTDGNGYWLVASDGGIFSYGDATFYGSTGGIPLNKPIVGMAATNDGNGYWLVASDGGIFSYGDATFYGSTGAIRLNMPIIGMAPTPDGRGYWLVGYDGGIFTFGDAYFYGSAGGRGVYAYGILINPSTPGYGLVTADGSSAFFGPGQNPYALSSDGLQQGVYVGAADPSGVASFAGQTRTSVTVASDYLPSSSGWSGMDGAGGGLDWLLDPWKGTGYTLSLGVPIIPTNSSGTAVATLAQGATGAYNSYYVTLAQALIGGGQANAYLRLGFEFDGGWDAWSAKTAGAEASFASYFQQIVTAMRSVPGAAFRFVWNPDATAFNSYPYSVAPAYPGNAYVDVIGLDAYDQTWATPQTPANAWSSTLLPALTAAQQFAASHGKPLAFPEWGVAIRDDGHGLGDDPNYINQMASWMHNPSNDVVYESYFDYDDSGGVNSQITGGSFPNSLAAFSADLG
jgi:hypothetical protein